MIKGSAIETNGVQNFLMISLCSLWQFFLMSYLILQIFRSIDSSSVKDFPKEPKDAPSKVKDIYACYTFIKSNDRLNLV